MPDRGSVTPTTRLQAKGYRTRGASGEAARLAIASRAPWRGGTVNGSWRRSPRANRPDRAGRRRSRASPGGEPCLICMIDRHPPNGTEGDVPIARRRRAPAGDDPEDRGGHAVGDRVLALVHAAHPDREEHRVVEGRRAREVGDLDSKVVDHRRQSDAPGKMGSRPPRRRSQAQDQRNRARRSPRAGKRARAPRPARQASRERLSTSRWVTATVRPSCSR